MRSYIKKIFALIFALALISLAQDDCKSTVTIITNNEEANIFVNDSLVAVGNTTLEMKPGYYEIVIIESISKWGSDVFNDSLTIKECNDTIELTYNFENRTLLKSVPDAAVIYKDTLIGYTPILIPLKYENLSIEKRNYRRQNISLPSVTQSPRITLDYIGKENKQPFIETTLFKVLIGSALVLGSTAAYFKLEADKNFDRYTETRNREFLDQTDKYDLYSGLAFGALQLNLGALLYYFLFE